MAALRRDAFNNLGLITAQWRREMPSTAGEPPGAAVVLLKTRCRSAFALTCFAP
jgi:hypothetical protein